MLLLHSDYVASKNDEKAPSAMLRDHIKMKQESVFDENKKYDEDIIADRDAHGISPVPV